MSIGIKLILFFIWRNGYANYLSLGGIYAPKKENTTAKLPRALSTFLGSNENISHIALCLDNDAIGRKASRFIGVKLSRKGYIVKDVPPQDYKDYNDYINAIL